MYIHVYNLPPNNKPPHPPREVSLKKIIVQQSNPNQSENNGF